MSKLQAMRELSQALGDVIPWIEKHSQALTLTRTLTLTLILIVQAREDAEAAPPPDGNDDTVNLHWHRYLAGHEG